MRMYGFFPCCCRCYHLESFFICKYCGNARNLCENWANTLIQIDLHWAGDENPSFCSQFTCWLLNSLCAVAVEPSAFCFYFYFFCLIWHYTFRLLSFGCVWVCFVYLFKSRSKFIEGRGNGLLRCIAKTLPSYRVKEMPFTLIWQLEYNKYRVYLYRPHRLCLLCSVKMNKPTATLAVWFAHIHARAYKRSRQTQVQMSSSRTMGCSNISFSPYNSQMPL